VFGGRVDRPVARGRPATAARVLLNLISNGFYAATKRKTEANKLLLRGGQNLPPTTGLGVGTLLGKLPCNVEGNTFDDIAATVG
jgi:hypothetical protein